MVGENGGFRRGAIYLGDENEEVPAWSQSPTKTPTPWPTIALYWLMICASIVGLGSLIWALSILTSYDWGDGAWPYLHQAFKEKYSPVTGLLLMSVFWASTNLLSLRKQRGALPDIFSTVYDILMIVALLYFPAVCCSWLSDNWETLACEYLRNTDRTCLPAYTKILLSEITGLVCAYLVSLFHLLLIIVRVVTLIVDLHGKGRSRPLGRWLYQRGYSTEIAIYCVSGSLSILDFCLMMWVCSSLLYLGGRADVDIDIWITYFQTGFWILIILLLTVPLWLLANLISLCTSRKALSPRSANVYDLSIGVGLIWISLHCAKRLDQLTWFCRGTGYCQWIWASMRRRHMAVIVLGIIVGAIHLSLFLFRLNVHIRSTRAKDCVTVSVALLHEVDTRNWSEDRVAALRYALQEPETDAEAEAPLRPEVDDHNVEEEEQISIYEVYPFLANFGRLFERARLVLLGPKATPLEAEDEDEFAALISANNQENMESERPEDEIPQGDVEIETRARTASDRVMDKYREPQGAGSKNKPLASRLTEDRDLEEV